MSVIIANHSSATTVATLATTILKDRHYLKGGVHSLTAEELAHIEISSKYLNHKTNQNLRADQLRELNIRKLESIPAMTCMRLLTSNYQMSHKNLSSNSRMKMTATSVPKNESTRTVD